MHESSREPNINFRIIYTKPENAFRSTTPRIVIRKRKHKIKYERCTENAVRLEKPIIDVLLHKACKPAHQIANDRNANEDTIK